ncbi:MAG TPA: heavy metal translocating P-type ATPase [Rickettsiales bacterium]|nr:heavy metal translocating P-type ATPase [Rickettsiales bacterium]
MNTHSPEIDFSSFVQPGKEEDSHSINLMVEGMRCASCAWRIESALNSEHDVNARVNLSTNRMVLNWKGDTARGNALVAKAADLGFKFLPFDASSQNNAEANEERFLLKCIAVAGFAAGNIMLFSFALWSTSRDAMGPATSDLIHWISAMIALPAVAYSGRPYFASALKALRSFHTNMDVPISLAVLLAAGMSLFETVRRGPYVYFDSSVMLLFLLLVGRYLDKRARGKARAAAQDLLAMMQGTATLREGDKTRSIAIRDILPGMRLLVAAGEKVAADGIVAKGVSDIDTSLITGETVPQRAAEGQKLFAGMINISAPLELTVSAASEQSLLADIVRLMENAEQGQAKYVRVADKVAGYYTPVVHLLAGGTFLFWVFAMGIAWQPALMIATTVLIITCPCALGLAVPAVQVVASSFLFKKGMLLKSGDALERLAVIDTVVFDKTGTLTLGKPQLENAGSYMLQDLQLAASLAAHSKHPLSRAIHQAWNGELLKLTIQEVPGDGLSAEYQGKNVRLGRRGWCGDESASQDAALELWLNTSEKSPVRFTFTDILRPDAADVVREFKRRGCNIVLLSGDREPAVKAVAQALEIADFTAHITPLDKSSRIHALKEKGAKVLMVGDGLNDAPALAAADVSISPSSAIDITQNAADVVFQGEHLMPVIDALHIARTSGRLVKQNFVLSFLYNIIAVPLAIAGQVTPLIAALAMSSSSIIVIANALRLNRIGKQKS